MNILKLDNEIKTGRKMHGSPGTPVNRENNHVHFQNQEKLPRVSAVTKARLEQKQIIQQMLLSSTTPPSYSPRLIKSNTNENPNKQRKISSAATPAHLRRRRAISNSRRSSRSLDRSGNTTPRGVGNNQKSFMNKRDVYGMFMDKI